MWYIEAKMQNAGSCKIYETFGNLKCTKVCGKLENTEFTEKCGNAKYGNDQTSINAPLGFIQYFAHRSFDVNNWQYALYISLQKLNDFAERSGFRISVELFKAHITFGKPTKTPNAAYLVKSNGMLMGF